MPTDKVATVPVAKKKAGAPEDQTASEPESPKTEAPSSSESGKREGVTRAEEGPGPSDEKIDTETVRLEGEEKPGNPKEDGGESAQNSSTVDDEKKEEPPSHLLNFSPRRMPPRGSENRSSFS